jgi:hypothetical protein
LAVSSWYWNSDRLIFFMKIKMKILYFLLILLTGCSLKPEEVLVEATFPCGVNDKQLIYSSQIVTEERILIVSNISVNTEKVIYGFTNSEDARIFNSCNFPEELKPLISSKIRVKYKLYNVENLNIRENPIEIISYKIL